MRNNNFLFLICSSRKGGNSELIARRAAQKLSPEVNQTWLNLIDLPLPEFEDVRHDEEKKFQISSKNEEILLEATLSATDIVFVSPIYWYNLSASAKLYLDYWTAWMRLPEADFTESMAKKKLWGICVLSDAESSDGAKPLIDTLCLTARYLGMKWGGVLLGCGNRPGDVLKDAGSLQRADKFFVDMTLSRSGDS